MIILRYFFIICYDNLYTIYVYILIYCSWLLEFGEEKIVCVGILGKKM